MAMIRRADFREVARDAVVLNLGDLLAQGEAIKRAARDQAEAMLASARAERDRLVSGGAADGRAQGLARGLEEGRAQGLAEGRAQAAGEHRVALEAIEKAWTEGLAAFEGQRERLLTEAKQDVVRLALAIAGRVTHRLVEAEPGIVADQLGAVLSLVSRPTRLRIFVHPDDRAVAEEALPGLLARLGESAHASLEADATLPRGSCIARGEGGAGIDASISTQLDRIAEALAPGSARAAPDAGPAPVDSAEGTEPAP